MLYRRPLPLVGLRPQNYKKINDVDFCHDSAIIEQAQMALAAPKVESKNYQKRFLAEGLIIFEIDFPIILSVATQE